MSITLTLDQFNEIKSFINKQGELQTEAFKLKTMISTINEPTSDLTRLHQVEDEELKRRLTIHEKKSKGIHVIDNFTIVTNEQVKKNIDTLLHHFGLQVDSFKNFLLEHGAIVAGGSALWMINPFCTIDKYDGDIDVFFPCDSQVLSSVQSKRVLNMFNGTTFKYLDEHTTGISNTVNFSSSWSSERAQKIYADIPNIEYITSFKNDKNQQIQFIFLKTPYVKAHVRTFDMSVCQCLFNGQYVSIASQFKLYTMNGFNQLLKPVDINKDNKFYNRVVKYAQRGFKPFSNSRNNVDSHHGFILASKTTPPSIRQIQVVRDPVQPITDIIEYCDKLSSIDPIIITNIVLPRVIESMKPYTKNDTRIGYPFKQRCEELFQMVFKDIKLDRMEDPVGFKKSIHDNFITKLVQQKDIRWLLKLIHSDDNDYSKFFIFTTEDYNSAKQHGVARDNLALIKSLITQHITRELDVEIYY